MVRTFSTSIKRSLAVSLLGALGLGFVSAATPSSIQIATTLAASSGWLDRFNLWRTSSGTSNLSENAVWSNGDYLHSVYMVKNNVITHTETVGAPYYTQEGYDAGRNGNIYVSSSTNTTDEAAIDWWMGAPFHALGMMDPRLTQTGFGSYRDTAAPGWRMAASLDVLRGNSFTSGLYTLPVFLPGNGATEPLISYGGNESPDPLTQCPGYTAPSGLPVFVQ